MHSGDIEHIDEHIDDCINETTKETTNEKSIMNEKSIIKTSNASRWNITLSQSEIKLLKQIVFLESGNESENGIIAVTEVILNRIYSDSFPNTLQKVVSQRNAFSTYKNRNIANGVYTSVLDFMIPGS